MTGAPTADGRGGDGRGRRAALGYALLFSAPVGVGVAAAVTRVAGVPLSAPVAAGPGLVAALALFGFVLLTLHTGEADPRRRSGG